MRDAMRAAPGAAALAFGCLALAGRRPGWGATIIVAVVGLAALLAPVGRDAARERRAGNWAAAVLVGCAAFAATAALSPSAGLSAGRAALGAAAVAAVAEEAFFRRTAFAWLSPAGPLAAAGLTAILFAVVHVPAYGAGVLPIDLAAGLLFGWQRHVAGTWTAPAATHVFANLVQSI